MRDAQFLREAEDRNPISDWTIRIGVAAFYLVFGLEKFSAAEQHWVTLFRDIGIGDWFRQFTGCVEALGAVLVLVPRTAVIGLTLLSATMAAAALILALRLHQVGASLFPALFFLVLAALAWNRYGSERKMRAQDTNDCGQQPLQKR
jgi:putative oxidoreductase